MWLNKHDLQVTEVAKGWQWFVSPRTGPHRNCMPGVRQYAKRPMYFGLGEPIHAMASPHCSVAYKGRLFQDAVGGLLVSA